jgi:alkanesulfonate monooxygenase SsuD/methylene tetrahydromethanopterin reductase-like flavin-dependent oxidoreductase (luciferase family)
VTVRLGLYLDLRNPGAERPWADVYRRSFERVVEGERLGLGAVWTTEHHGVTDGYLPQPLTVCAALAARTTRIRIGTAVLLVPFRHPLAIAEEAAVVDIISDGRLELGLGAGWREDEFAAFGVDRRGRYARLERVAGQLEEMWESGSATPPPVQRPLPLWLGVRGPRGARAAGRLGAGLLWIDRALLGPYLEGLEEGGHPAESARMAGLVNVVLADDPERAERIVLPAARAARAAAYRGGEGLERLRVVTPADAAGVITDQVRGLPVTDVFCFDRIGGTDDDLADRHVELLATALPPLLEAAGNQPVSHVR